MVFCADIKFPLTGGSLWLDSAAFFLDAAPIKSLGPTSRKFPWAEM